MVQVVQVEIMVTETEMHQRFQLLQVVQEVQVEQFTPKCRWYVKRPKSGSVGAIRWTRRILKVVVQQVQVHQLVHLSTPSMHKMVFQIHFQTYHHYHCGWFKQVEKRCGRFFRNKTAKVQVQVVCVSNVRRYSMVVHSS